MLSVPSRSPHRFFRPIPTFSVAVWRQPHAVDARLTLPETVDLLGSAAILQGPPPYADGSRKRHLAAQTGERSDGFS
jgi:hypothetical protein